ncbi:MAG: energy transducer TonB [Gammaproteobacteria bacterium]|nr:energy transducer TonB [Gammaproteobacteria bacterium]
MYSTVLVPGFLSRRALAGAGILALHLLIAYVLLTAFMQPAAPPAPSRIAATFITEPAAPPTPLPTVSGPSLAPTVRPEPVPVPPIDLPVVEPAPVAVVVPAPAPHPAAASEAPLRLLGRHQLPDSADYYPPDLIRLGVTGVTEVGVCVDERGVRSGEPGVVASSGNARLDEGALTIARHGRYARALRGDTPVSNCYRFRIVFRMH